MNNDALILQKIGELSGLMTATREDVKQVSDSQKDHSSSIQLLTTSVQLIQQGFSNVTTEIAKINNSVIDSCGRIDTLEQDKTVKEGIVTHNTFKAKRLQWSLGILAVFLGILLSISQISSVVKTAYTKDIGTQSVYANQPYVIKKDSSLKFNNNTVTVGIDTIRVNK